MDKCTTLGNSCKEEPVQLGFDTDTMKVMKSLESLFEEIYNLETSIGSILKPLEECIEEQIKDPTDKPYKEIRQSKYDDFITDTLTKIYRIKAKVTEIIERNSI